MNTYRTSNNERVTKKAIDGRIRKAKAEKLLSMEFLCCERCGTTQGYIDMSHKISVKRCQEEGMSELAWDTSNLELLCRGCHIEVENMTSIDRKAL